MNSNNEVDDYIAKTSDESQAILERIRKIIKSTAPDAIESMAYGMPAYKLNGKPLVYFAGFTNHIGFYATPEMHDKFSKELSKYKQGKGSVQFPLGQSIPYELIEAMVISKISKLNSAN